MELSNYIKENPNANDVCSVNITLKFLEACQKLFENGLLSHSRVTHMKSDVICSVEEGYLFFTNWLQEIIKMVNDFYIEFPVFVSFIDPNFDYASSTQKSFLAWQSKQHYSS